MCGNIEGISVGVKGVHTSVESVHRGIEDSKACTSKWTSVRTHVEVRNRQ